MDARDYFLRSVAMLFGLLGAAMPVAAEPDGAKALAYAAVERNPEEIATIGDSVYYFAELGMQEYESAKFVRQVLESIGFTVEVGAAGMPTNIWAHWGTGKPQIVIVSEMDALPGGSQTPGSIERKPLIAGAPGHMEGHNTHPGVAIGAAYAVKQAMQRYNIPGSIAISLGPAEEQIISRPYLVRAGQFKDSDIAILLHLGDNFAAGYGLMNYAAISAKFTFHGKTAHGAVNPWDGKDAVDAVELMDIGFDKLREHLRPTYRAHRAITSGGIQRVPADGRLGLPARLPDAEQVPVDADVAGRDEVVEDAARPRWRRRHEDEAAVLELGDRRRERAPHHLARRGALGVGDEVGELVEDDQRRREATRAPAAARHRPDDDVVREHDLDCGGCG